MKQNIFFTYILTTIISAGYSQPGTLDPKFASNGVYYDSFSIATNKAALLQSNGKIVLGGYGSEGSQTGFFLKRLTEKGLTDSSFGNYGTKVIDIAFFDEVTSLALQADGKIVAVGSSYLFFVRDEDFKVFYNMNFSITRILPNGDIDSSFGDNGIVQTDFGGVEEAYSVAIQKDGKILVGGSTGALPPSQNVPKFLLVRYLPDGKIDSTFGVKGKVSTIFNSSTDDIIKKVLCLTDGSILVCGTINGARGINDSGDFALAKYLSNGDLDESFGTGGKVTTSMNRTGSLLMDAILLKEGKILTSGVTNYGNDSKIRPVLVQYNTDGSIDSEFGVQGIQEIIFSDGKSEGRSIASQHNGKIIMTSAIGFTNSSAVVVIRLLSNGSIDSSFGVNGRIIQEIGLFDNPTDVLVQEDGKIVVSGDFSEFIGSNIFAARYYGDPTHPLFSKIRRWIHRNILNFTDANGTATQYNIEQQNSGGGFATIASLLPNKNNSYSYNISNYTSATVNSNFRIKAVYADGSTVYSEVVTQAALQADTKVSISPNPASFIIHIAMKENAMQTGTAYIYDAMGNQVQTQSFAKQTKLSINISSLQQGHYRVVVNSNGIISESNFLKE